MTTEEEVLGATITSALAALTVTPLETLRVSPAERTRGEERDVLLVIVVVVPDIDVPPYSGL